MKYSIDTSAILDGWVRYYPPSVFPSIWQNIETLIDSEELKAIDEVLSELKRKDDDVYKWAKRHAKRFLSIDEHVQRSVTEILSKYPGLVDKKRNRSLADPFVVATAQVHSLVVVTGEVRTNRLEKPRIPDVCGAMGIDCITLLDLFQREGWKI